jgi:hypothetical protein
MTPEEFNELKYWHRDKERYPRELNWALQASDVAGARARTILHPSS